MLTVYELEELKRDMNNQANLRNTEDTKKVLETNPELANEVGKVLEGSPEQTQHGTIGALKGGALAAASGATLGALAGSHPAGIAMAAVSTAVPGALVGYVNDKAKRRRIELDDAIDKYYVDKVSL